MPRISDADRARNEEAIRAAIDRLLRGELPSGRTCDLKTLAAEAGVTRTGFNPRKNRDGTTRPGPHQHRGEEFERRLKAQCHAGEAPEPRTAQIERLKAENAELRNRITVRDESIAELKASHVQAVSQQNDLLDADLVDAVTAAADACRGGARIDAPVKCGLPRIDAPVKCGLPRVDRAVRTAYSEAMGTRKRRRVLPKQMTLGPSSYSYAGPRLEPLPREVRAWKAWRAWWRRTSAPARCVASCIRRDATPGTRAGESSPIA
ncbi:hypothetical protein SUDANB105_07788 [Streptomyces sp. enrichment culture]|uniref:hypothetical protein n=1 Tax=Streptomyces sp. enrichment culture TaxID=1795815 RepID=UPI003F5785F2